MQTRFGDDLHRVIVVPLARGPFGYYSDWSERDVLDVIADVRSTYPIDDDRIFSGGYSMGGYGALRLAAMYPDLFAGAISWVGYTGDCLNGTPLAGRCPTGAVGNALDYLENLRHVPTANLYAAADELVHVHTGNAVRQRFADLGYEHVFWMHTAEHLTLAVLDSWVKESAWTKGRTRVHDPARVTYRTNPYLGNVPLGIVHDRAYWVSAIRTAKAGDGIVDLTSHACDPRSEHRYTTTNGAGIEPVPWVSQESVDAGVEPITPGRYLTGSLRNIASLTLDVRSPCFAPDLSRVEVDVPTTIRFSDGRQPVTHTP
jgi:dienelactone hydrolase